MDRRPCGRALTAKYGLAKMASRARPALCIRKGRSDGVGTDEPAPAAPTEGAQRMNHQAGRRSAAALAWRNWYGMARWKGIRAAQLQAQPWSAFCLEAGDRVAAVVCDHVNRHNGDPLRFWSGPFQSLCAGHHDASKQREERKGYSTAIGEDGWPVSPMHPANSGRLPKGGGRVVVGSTGPAYPSGGRTLQRSLKKGS
jgi:5-methylcytosine-specific restriction enzyme A